MNAGKDSKTGGVKAKAARPGRFRKHLVMCGRFPNSAKRFNREDWLRTVACGSGGCLNENISWLCITRPRQESKKVGTCVSLQKCLEVGE